jgi:hypothetical protein
MYKLMSQNNSTSQRYILTGFLAFALIATATPALAKDHHNSKYKVFYSHHDKHGYDKHYYKHKRIHQSYGKKHHKKHSYRHKAARHHRQYLNYSHDYRHDFDRHYYKHGHHYKHRNHFRHGHSNYVDGYFAILGGTILINELLYHSHQHR